MRLTKKDKELIASLETAEWCDVRGYKDYSWKPDLEKHAAAKLIKRLLKYV
jgi:hypothetical protein